MAVQDGCSMISSTQSGKARTEMGSQGHQLVDAPDDVTEGSQTVFSRRGRWTFGPGTIGRKQKRGMLAI